MIIQVDGTNSVNKGAELMLYAVVEQLEKTGIDTEIYLNTKNNERIPKLIKLPNVKKRFFLKYGIYILKIFKKLKIPTKVFSRYYVWSDKIDMVLDASGFQFSDQWNYDDNRLRELEKYYYTIKKNGGRIVLLPQAFGPFKTNNGLKAVKIIDKYVDIIIAREKVSYNHLLKSNVNLDKLWLYPDFTCLVDGVVDGKYKSLKGYVCFIPNKKMVTHGNLSEGFYIDFMVKIIEEFQNINKEIFILNHESDGDFEICTLLNSKFNNKFQIVSDIDAKEVKGVIGNSFFVVSSRFHGVASSLNSGVPCLATSWSHKYELLYNDYGLRDMVLDVNNDWSISKSKIKDTLINYNDIKNTMELEKNKLTELAKEMWNKILHP